MSTVKNILQFSAKNFEKRKIIRSENLDQKIKVYGAQRQSIKLKHPEEIINERDGLLKKKRHRWETSIVKFGIFLAGLFSSRSYFFRPLRNFLILFFQSPLFLFPFSARQRRRSGPFDENLQ